MPSAFFLGAAAALALAQVNVSAQPYPAKPIRIIIPFGPGGPSDLLARTVGQKLTESWGQQVLIVTRNRHRFPSCEAIATTAGLVDRLLQAWLLPRSIAISPALRRTSCVSSTSTISPSSTIANSSVRVCCM